MHALCAVGREGLLLHNKLEFNSCTSLFFLFFATSSQMTDFFTFSVCFSVLKDYVMVDGNSFAKPSRPTDFNNTSEVCVCVKN